MNSNERVGEQVFVLWVSRSTDQNAVSLNGRIEHVATGSRIEFDSEAALMRFLQTWPPPGESASSDSFGAPWQTRHRDETLP